MALIAQNVLNDFSSPCGNINLWQKHAKHIGGKVSTGHSGKKAFQKNLMSRKWVNFTKWCNFSWRIARVGLLHWPRLWLNAFLQTSVLPYTNFFFCLWNNSTCLDGWTFLSVCALQVIISNDKLYFSWTACWLSIIVSAALSQRVPMKVHLAPN